MPRAPFRLGLVTYNIARDWDLATLIEKCTALGFEAVELRTTHAHGVEPELSAAARREVRQRFADSPVRLLSLGTTCEYHAPDPAELERQIERTAAFIRLAADVGALGVKVRPNGLPAGVPVEKTLQQIGEALARCGAIAAEHGVEVWLEVHGRGTQELPNIRRIMEHAAHPQVGVCWNSNPTDVVDGSIDATFAMVRDRIRSVHITELTNDYPWRRLFQLLTESGYDRYTLAEIGASADAERLLRYYAALWRTLTESAA
ncbi:MAG TPA: TIM barrel protein [Limnochordia bacterium]